MNYKHLTYVGSIPVLKGESALVIQTSRMKKVKAQFDNINKCGKFCFGWHPFDKQDFKKKTDE